MSTKEEDVAVPARVARSREAIGCSLLNAIRRRRAARKKRKPPVDSLAGDERDPVVDASYSGSSFEKREPEEPNSRSRFEMTLPGEVPFARTLSKLLSVAGAALEPTEETLAPRLDDGVVDAGPQSREVAVPLPETIGSEGRLDPSAVSNRIEAEEISSAAAQGENTSAANSAVISNGTPLPPMSKREDVASSEPKKPSAPAWANRFSVFGLGNHKPHVPVVASAKAKTSAPTSAPTTPTTTAPSTSGTVLRRALQIGINYVRSPNELVGCVHDVRNVSRYLQSKRGYAPSDLVSLTDDPQSNEAKPTMQNIRRAIADFVAFAASVPVGVATELFFQYSGHGTSVKDQNGDEKDGVDEALVPSDFQTAGLLLDDELSQILLKPLAASPNAANCTFLVLVDACRSGTCLDLPFRWTGGNLFSVEAQSSFGNLNAACISGCRDDQYSSDLGNRGGAMTGAFLAQLANNGSLVPNWAQLLGGMRSALSAYNQEPQLTSTFRMDTNRPFGQVTQLLGNAGRCAADPAARLAEQRSSVGRAGGSRLAARKETGGAGDSAVPVDSTPPIVATLVENVSANGNVVPGDSSDASDSPTIADSTQPTVDASSEPTVSDATADSTQPTVDASSEPTVSDATADPVQPTVDASSEPTASDTTADPVQPTVDTSSEPTVSDATADPVQPTLDTSLASDPTVDSSSSPVDDSQPTADASPESTTCDPIADSSIPTVDDYYPIVHVQVEPSGNSQTEGAKPNVYVAFGSLGDPLLQTVKPDRTQIVKRVKKIVVRQTFYFD